MLVICARQFLVYVMVSIFAPLALLPQGWSGDVRVTLGVDGTIAFVQTGVSAQPGDEVFADRALLPGMANLHSHSFQRAMAGLTEAPTSNVDAARDSFWSWRALMYRFLEELTPEDVEAIAALTFMEMLEAGYTSVGEFHYLHHQPDGTLYDNPAELSHRIVAASDETGIGLTLLPVLYCYAGLDKSPLEGGQKRFGNDPERFARLWQDARAATDRVAGDARCGLAAHSLRAVDCDGLNDLRALDQTVPLHIHVSEQTKEVADVEAALGARPIRWLLDNQPVDASWCLIHATHMDTQEVQGMARSGAVAGLCPITEANLGDGIFMGRDYLSHGGAFGIGSDSNVRIALGQELASLEYSQRLSHRGRSIMAAEGRSSGRTLYDCAVRGGAGALGRGDGGLQAGSYADLVAIDLTTIHTSGLGDDRLLDAWVFAADDTLVSDVWSAGRHVVRDGTHVGRDEIIRRAMPVLQRLRENC